jgi:hypothetical protein
MPAQLTCNQGRKKQSSMNAAVLRVSFRASLMKIIFADERVEAFHRLDGPSWCWRAVWIAHMQRLPATATATQETQTGTS